MLSIEEIAERKRSGIDCTENESAVVMAWFDQYESLTTAEEDELAGLFPLEFAQWADEREQGVR